MKNKYFIKSTLLSLLVGASLTACNSGHSSSATTLTTKQTNNLKAGPPLQAVYIGAPAVSTVDGTMVIPKANSCVEFPEDRSLVKAFYSVAGTGTRFTMEKNLSTEELLDRLGVNASLKGSISSVSGDFKADYENAHSASKLEYRVTMYGSQEGRFGITSNNWASNRPNDLANCGDGFVAGGIGGLYYEGSLIVKFASTKDKQALLADGKLNAKDLADLAGKLEIAKETSGINFDVKLELAQRGGDSSQIFKTFTEQYNLNNEINSGTFYLAELSTDNMVQAVNAMQNYIQTTLAKQAESLHNITSLDQIDDNVYLTIPDKATYSNSQSSFTRSPGLRNAVSLSNSSYEEMQKYKLSYTNFVRTVSDFVGRKDALPVIKNSTENLRLMNNWQNLMLDVGKECFGYVVPASDNEKQCIEDLTKQSKNAIDLIEILESTGWQYGYKINARGTTREGFIPISADDNGVVTSFVTVSNNIATSFYFPGTEYYFDPKLKTMEVRGVDPVYALETESFVLSNRAVKYNDVTPVVLGDSAITTSGVAYSDIENGFDVFKTNNYPGLASDSSIAKSTRKAATSLSYVNLLGSSN